MKNIGIILGSGLDKFTDELSDAEIISEDPEGIHNKKIVRGIINGRTVTVFSGRNHIYENPGKEKLFSNVNYAKNNGIDFLIITNAAGGLRNDFRIADLMLITSYINFQYKFQRGNIKSFPEDKELFRQVSEAAVQNYLSLKQGVYLASTGPMYETNAEISFYKKYNVDAVGMSTLPEVYLANQYNIKTLGISCITNLLSTENHSGVSHSEVLQAGKTAYDNFSKLLKLIISL
jgi:purine-nucleoside phosphorylase